MKRFNYCPLHGKLVLLLIFLFSVVNLKLHSQIAFDFEKELTSWEYEPKHWEITDSLAINGYSLHHSFDNDVSGTDQISYRFKELANKNKIISWNFSLKHAYLSSSSNNWAVFLVSDADFTEMYPKSSANAIVLGVNYSGSNDTLCLWQQEKGVITTILATDLNWEKTIGNSTANILVSKFSDGQWNIKVFDNSGNMVANKKSYTIAFFPEPYYTGIYFKYSSTQDQKLWFDDYSIFTDFQKDTIQLKIDTFYLKNKNRLLIRFNKPIDFTSLKKENFQSATVSVKSIVKQSSAMAKIEFETSLKNDTNYNLLVKNIKDFNGISISETTLVLNYHLPRQFDVLITEVMPDPEPQVSLPNAEYIELLNNSGKKLDISGWKLKIGNSEYKMPPGSLEKDSFFILTLKGKENGFESFGKSLGIFTSSYSLPNDNGFIVLKDSSDNLISFVNYESSWYDKFKVSGGWSLEMIDITNPCNMKSNWKTCQNQAGGTPGKKNSVSGLNPDKLQPSLQAIRILNNSSIMLRFSEPIWENANLTPANFIVNEIGEPVLVSYFQDDCNSLILTFSDQFQRNTIYTLNVKNDICDCSQNKLNPQQLNFGVPEEPDSSDIIINEVLFNAYTKGTKFIEIFNKSQKIVHTGKLFFITRDTFDYKIKASIGINDTGSFILPGEYMAVTPDTTVLRRDYILKKSLNISENKYFPTLDDNCGIICLMNYKFQTLDSFYYSSTFHTGFLSSTDGVSLERLSAELSSINPSNWHSAAQTAGFATPGYENSIHFLIPDLSEEDIKLSAEVITPNQDGIDDFLQILFSQKTRLRMCKIDIYSSSGMLIKEILQKNIMGTDFSIHWDGSNESNQLVSSGIYIIHISITEENGKITNFKKTVVVSRQ